MGMRRLPITVSSLSIQSMVLDYSKIGNPMTTPPTEIEVEKLARLFCVEAGLDPDVMVQIGIYKGSIYSGKMWIKYLDQARDHICMARAYEKVRIQP